MLLKESGILGFGIRNSAKNPSSTGKEFRIFSTRNPESNDKNLESKPIVLDYPKKTGSSFWMKLLKVLKKKNDPNFFLRNEDFRRSRLLGGVFCCCRVQGPQRFGVKHCTGSASCTVIHR